MVAGGERYYRVEFFVDNEPKPYLKGGKLGPFLRVRVSSNDDQHPEITNRSYLESQIGVDAVSGSSRFYLLHQTPDSTLMVHNLFLKTGMKFDEFDKKNTYPLVLGQVGILKTSIRNAIARHVHDDVFVIGRNNKNNFTGERYEANPKAVIAILEREIDLGGLDRALDFSVFAAGSGPKLEMTEQELSASSVEIMNHPAILHRSSRPLISTLDLTIGEIIKLDLDSYLGQKRIRGLSVADIEAFAEYLERESYVNATQAKPNEPDITEPKLKAANVPEKAKPKLLQRFKRSGRSAGD